jgi:hypothetical protein
MPFSMFSPQPSYLDYAEEAQQPQPYSGLSLEDLWRPDIQAQVPEPPKAIGSARDLDEERRKAIRRNAILQAAMAFGQGASNPGQMGVALTRAAMESGDFRDSQLAEANAFQQSEYQRQRQLAEQHAQQERAGLESETGRRRAEALVGMVHQIADADPGLASQAELAARSGDEKRLQELLGDVRRRSQMRQYGMDPDDPYADDRMKGLMKTQDEIEREKQLKALGLDSYFVKPEPSTEEEAARAGAIAEAQARARAKYRDPSEGPEGIRPRFVETDDSWGMMRLDPSGNPVFVPAQGAPPRPPKVQLFQGDIAADDPLYRAPYAVKIRPDGTMSAEPIRPPRPAPPPKKEERSSPFGAYGKPPEKKTPSAPQKDPAKQRVEAQARIVERSLGGGFTPQERKAVEQALAQGQAPGQIVAKIKRLRGR